MDKRYTENEIEEMLTHLKDEKLNTELLEGSKKQVWSKLSAQLSVTTNNMEPSNTTNLQKQKVSWQQFFTYKNFIYLGSGLSIFLILFSAGFLYYNKNNPTKNSTNKDNIAANSPTKSVGEIKQLAAVRLKEISGLTPEDLNKISASVNKLDVHAAENGSAGKVSSSNVNTDTSKEISQEKKVNDDKIYYVELETMNYAPDVRSMALSGVSNSVDFKKPATSKTWISANYNKNLLIQDQKVVAANIFTPNYSLDYYGGKYAIKETFQEGRYLNGMSFNAEGNFELEFLKYILQNETVKNLGKQTKDGREYTVLEIKNQQDGFYSAGTAMNTTDATKFYVDLDKFELYLTEEYRGDQLVSTTKKIQSKLIENSDPAKIFNNDELNNIEIKQVTSRDYNTVYDQNTVSNFIKKYKYLYVDTPDSNVYASDSALYNDKEINDLRNSKDFNPNLDDNIIESSKNVPVGNYSTEKYSVDIFETKPRPEAVYKIENVQQTTVIVDGKSIPAEYYVSTYEVTTPGPDDCKKGTVCAQGAPAPNSTKYLGFNLDKYYYRLSSQQENINIQPGKPAFTFKSLSAVEAEKYDKINKERSDAYPMTTINNSFEGIDPQKSLLPGDLSKKYKIFAISISKSQKKTETTCLNYLESSYMLPDCLIEKYNGFGIMYSQKYDNNNGMSSPSSSSTFSTINLSVLDTELKNLDINKLASDLKAKKQDVNVENYKDTTKINDTQANMSLVFLEVKGKTVIINTASQYNGLSLDDQIEIVKNMDFGKDGEILKKQMEENKITSGPGVSYPSGPTASSPTISR